MYSAKSDPVKTGEFIACLRKKHEMTQFALASALQVSHQAVSKWETGSALPDIDILISMANLFEVSVESLIFGGDEGADPLEADKIRYSETIAGVIKTKCDIDLLLEAFSEMREDDIADCIQTLRITDANHLTKLCTRLSSGKIAQVIKTLRLKEMLPFVASKMRRTDVSDCIQTLEIDDIEVIKELSELWIKEQ